MKTTTIQSLTGRKAWKALTAHYPLIQKLHLRRLLAEDAKRGQSFTAGAAGLFPDYAKNRVTDHTLELLFELVEESGLRGKTDATFGEHGVGQMPKVNTKTQTMKGLSLGTSTAKRWPINTKLQKHYANPDQYR